MSVNTKGAVPSDGKSTSLDSILSQYYHLSGGSPTLRGQQKRFLKAVKEDPSSAEAWWEFLKNEEQLQGTNTGHLHSQARSERGTVTLYHLFALATKTVPRQKNYDNKAYLHIWLGYARQQWQRSEDEARDTFKTLKSQLIGDSFAYLYSEWALLENQAGNVTTALRILKKGEACGAQPLSVLESARSTIEQGRCIRQTMHNTANSNLSAVTGYMDPVTGQTCRRSPTLDLAGEATTAAVTATDPFVMRHNALALEKLPNQEAVTTGKVTLHTRTTATGFSHSSEEPSESLQVTQGQTAASVSSSGSADSNAETNIGNIPYSLKWPTAVAPASAEPGSNQPPLARKIAHRPVFQNIRRIGLGGGAARVRAAEQTSTQDITVEPVSLAEAAGIKRKALAELPTPQPPASIAASYLATDEGSKRRMSPEPEAIEQRAQPQLAPNLQPGHAPKRASEAKQQDAVVESDPESETDVPMAMMNSALSRKARDSMAPLAQSHVREANAAVARHSAPRDAGIGRKMERQTSQPLPSLLSADKPPQPRPTPVASARPEASGPLPTPVSSRAKLVPPLPPSHHLQPPLPAAPKPTSSQAKPSSLSQSEKDRQALRESYLERENQGRREAQPVHRKEQASEGSKLNPPRLEKENESYRREERQQHQAMAPPSSRPRPPLASIDRHREPERRQHHEAEEQRYYRRRDDNAIYVKGRRYTKLECVGTGGSSKVFKVMAEESKKIFALKQIRLEGRDEEAASGFIDEITLLQRLRGNSNIIQLIDAEVIQEDNLIYMVLEYGDIDLARLIARHEKRRRLEGAVDLDENFIRLYWQQMLQAVHTIHEARIVHSDLKPPNFLVVEGTLKLIDFGIAKAIQSDTTSIARETQVGTINYMSPEAVLGGRTTFNGGAPMKVGRPSDIWSLGCILYRMVHGRTPFQDLGTMAAKVHAITDGSYKIPFPKLKNAALQDTLKCCLNRDPRARISMQELLAHPFLRPSAAPVGLTRSQLERLLAQLSDRSDIGSLSDELFRKLSNGESVDLAALFAKAPVTGAKQPVKASSQRTATERATKAQKENVSNSRGLMQHDIQAGKAALKKVAAARPVPRVAEPSLEAKLRQGIAKLRFDDTAGPPAAEDDISNNFSP